MMLFQTKLLIFGNWYIHESWVTISSDEVVKPVDSDKDDEKLAITKTLGRAHDRKADYIKKIYSQRKGKVTIPYQVLAAKKGWAGSIWIKYFSLVTRLRSFLGGHFLRRVTYLCGQ